MVQWKLLRGSDTHKYVFQNLTPNKKHPTGYAVASLNKVRYDDYPCLVAQTNSKLIWQGVKLQLESLEYDQFLSVKDNSS